MIALALAVTLGSFSPRSASSPPPGTSIAPDGSVSVAGVSFQLPRGLAYAVQGTERAPRVHAARSADGNTYVGVAVLRLEREFGCESARAAELGLVPFRTARGHPACRASAHPEGAPLAAAAAYVNAAGAVVAVSVLAPSLREARALAEGVAASVELAPAPAAEAARDSAPPSRAAAEPDGRLLGCFERHRGSRYPDAGELVVATTLCLREDLTFTRTERRGVRFLRGGVPGGGLLRDERLEGRWSVRDDRLTLSFEDEDGDEAELDLEVGGVEAERLLLGGASWERRRDEPGDGAGEEE